MRRTGLGAILVLGLVGPAASAFTGVRLPMSVNETLARWESAGESVPPQSLLEYAETLRTHAGRGDERVLDRLGAIMTSKEQGEASRCIALEVACELVDDANSIKILGVLDATLQELRQATAAGKDCSDQRVFANIKMVTTFLIQCAPHLTDTMGDQQGLVALLKSCYLHGEQPRGLKDKCVRRIRESKAPLAVRQQALVDVIIGSPQWDARPELLAAVDPSTYPALREVVRAGRTPDGFNFLAADVLSYHGDLEIAPDLESLRPIFLAKHVNLEGVLRKYLWRIEVQHPPSKLLEHIVAAGYPDQHEESRWWAVKRANELGIDPQRIREAILEHAARASTLLEQACLPDLKRLGARLGILRESDLPDVELPKEGVTP